MPLLYVVQENRLFDPMSLVAVDSGVPPLDLCEISAIGVRGSSSAIALVAAS